MSSSSSSTTRRQREETTDDNSTTTSTTTMEPVAKRSKKEKCDYLSKIPREALERIAASVEKNDMKEAMSILKEEKEKARKKIDEELLAKISKLPRDEVDKIVLAVHKISEKSGSGGGGGDAITTEAVSELKKSYENQKIRNDFLHKRDVWSNVMSFVGPGNYIFVAGVSKNLKKFYGEYFSTLGENELPVIRDVPKRRNAKLTDTFHREAFVSLSRAKFWDEDTTKQRRREDRLAENQICETIAKYGDVPTLEWARKQRGFPWDEDTCWRAARSGQLEALKHLHDNGCPWDWRTCREAVWAGRLDILQYTHENGCPWYSETCREAASRGRLDILRYAHENGCPWDEETCSYAAWGGHLRILQYARDNGCPWDEYTLVFAIGNGHQQIVEYARANGCPEPP